MTILLTCLPKRPTTKFFCLPKKWPPPTSTLAPFLALISQKEPELSRQQPPTTKTLSVNRIGKSSVQKLSFMGNRPAFLALRVRQYCKGSTVRLKTQIWNFRRTSLTTRFNNRLKMMIKMLPWQSSFVRQSWLQISGTCKEKSLWGKSRLFQLQSTFLLIVSSHADR